MYCVERWEADVAIPLFGASGLLPPGEHRATWEEVATRFRFSTRRRDLLRSMLPALLALRSAGCNEVFLDGSFVTAKRNPGDYDAAWDPVGVDPSLLDPTFLDFAAGRRAQKEKWGGEFFPLTARATPDGITYREYFRNIHAPPEKGIVIIDLRSIP